MLTHCFAYSPMASFSACTSFHFSINHQKSLPASTWITAHSLWGKQLIPHHVQHLTGKWPTLLPRAGVSIKLYWRWYLINISTLCSQFHRFSRCVHVSHLGDPLIHTMKGKRRYSGFPMMKFPSPNYQVTVFSVYNPIPIAEYTTQK